jgi:serine/threonine protein kinase/Tfp pilus assembly protein PilF
MREANADKPDWDRNDSAGRSDEAMLAFRGLCAGGPDSWGESRQDEPVRLYSKPENTDAKLAKLTDDLALLPEAGQEFLGFHLIGELGRGAFGRVYLARQGGLANRLVALKVAAGCFAESQKLARLQHSHIVPIYSVHEAGRLQAVCMPYFGPTTLADVLDDLGRRDTLPASGKGLVSTLHSRRTKSGVVSAVQPPSAPVVPSALAEGRSVRAGAADGPATLTTLRMLEGLSYVQAVLWIGARLAEGLAHAHERGVLHRDLKPANVLLTDEGQPMLLDFNLAEDVRAGGATSGRVGGTLPYMAPEHLAAYQGGPVEVDARSDIYALGVILYELLTGRHPFGRAPVAHAPGSRESAVERMIQDRRRLPPPAGKFNPSVTPAVDSILRRCLAPDPAQRYQAASELQDDLDRQRLHRPLRHAPDPSPRERIVKWLKRNPRAVTASRVGIAAGVLVLLLTGWLFWRGEELARHESADRLRGFHEDLNTARLLLGARAADVDQLDEGRDAARRALDRYQAASDDHWRDRPAVLYLSGEEKDRLQSETGELLVLLASATARQQGEPGGVSPRSDQEEALRMNRLAETCYADGQAPRALWEQRAWLESQLGHEDEARQLRERAEAAPVRDAWDAYLLARDQAGQGRPADAAERLRAVVAQEPNNFALQFLMGNCCLDGRIDDADREIDAVGCYSACIALRPDFHAAYANRGLVRLRRGLYAEAEADFSRALQLRPDWAVYYLDRAQAREGLHNDPGELDDLNEAEELGSKAVMLYYLRARTNQRMGRDVSARRDLDTVLHTDPVDEDGFVARGVALASDGKMDEALADFTEAVKRNPNSGPGLKDQATLLAEHLGRNREALAPLDRLVELYPTYGWAWGARAVVRARLGQRDDALADVKKARELDPSAAEVLYQSASVYALIGADREADRAEAFGLLCQALKRGFGWDQLDADGDLASLRMDPRYGDLKRAAKLMQNAERGMQN